MPWKPGKQGFKKKGETACSKRVKENEKKSLDLAAKKLGKKPDCRHQENGCRRFCVFIWPGGGGWWWRQDKEYKK